MDVTVTGPSGVASVIHATAHHLFWDVTSGSWVEAGAVRPGDRLRADDGATVTFTGASVVAGAAPMWDLTVAGVHDFYVSTATSTVLVHNIDCSTRLPQDSAVNSSPPEAMDTNRPVGSSATQNQFVQDRIDSLRDQGAKDFRVNQQQVNQLGERVGINRPDLQYTLNDQRFYEEFDTSLSNRGVGHIARILSNDPGGIAWPFNVD